MQTTFYFKTAEEIQPDIIDAIKIAFKKNAVSITIKMEAPEALSNIPEWQTRLALKKLEEIELGNVELKSLNEVKNSFIFKS
jgi:hypothetical protein